MQNVIKHTIYALVGITILTALVALGGIVYLWEDGSKDDLPYLEWLASITIAEIVAITLLYVKKGIRYLPDVKVNKTSEQTSHFMEDFISSGSSATIVSNRLSWLSGQQTLIDVLKEKIDEGLRIEVVTPEEVSDDIISKLDGANFFITKDSAPPQARFTLINGDRNGAERLAIARGTHPNHEITIFDNNSGPQIIAMAKDIIAQSKERSNEQ